MSEFEPYNPLDRENLGRSVASAILSRTAHPLGELPRFAGAGIYAIYYSGALPIYSAIANRNIKGRFEVPIYIGQAVPQGSRKGTKRVAKPETNALEESRPRGTPLYSRLKQHAASISATSDLRLVDFHCRVLVVDDIWISLGESMLIAMFSPVWNHLVEGFGNHNTGSGRHQGMRPRWDALHPGRPWANSLQPRKESADEIIADVARYLSVNPLPTPPDES